MHGDDKIPVEDWVKETRSDDQRRFEQLKPLLANKRVLDFGCGAGGFLLTANSLAAEVVGVELESRVRKFYENSEITILSSIEDAAKISGASKFDIISAFHVVEHLPDPREVLKKLGTMLTSDGRMVIEVPSAEDALLTLQLPRVSALHLLESAFIFIHCFYSGESVKTSRSSSYFDPALSAIPSFESFVLAKPVKAWRASVLVVFR